VKLDDCVLAEVESALARHYGYADIKHRLEFFGVCPDCQSASDQPAKGKRTRRVRA
jgi:Fe2+ or Zn2+ uptake regulation protein